eukprot:365449-Chlamydomonas_euryale.AAC.4
MAHGMHSLSEGQQAGWHGERRAQAQAAHAGCAPVPAAPGCGQRLWRTEHGTRHTSSEGNWVRLHSMYRMTHGTWCVPHGTWHIARTGWHMAHGAYRMAHGTWRVPDGTWHMVLTAWHMAHSAWRT